MTGDDAHARLRAEDLPSTPLTTTAGKLTFAMRMPASCPPRPLDFL